MQSLLIHRLHTHTLQQLNTHTNKQGGIFETEHIMLTCVSISTHMETQSITCVPGIEDNVITPWKSCHVGNNAASALPLPPL